MPSPSTTIVVVPRETHSAWAAMLARLWANTDPTVPVVVVDGGSPPRIRHQLERLADAHDFTLLRSERLLSSNEARNAGLGHVHTELVAFLDNDTHVPPGWLPGLEHCLRETGAALVSPVVLAPRGDTWEIHDAGGVARIVGEGEQRRFEERNAHMREPESAVPQLVRARTEFQELHCLLARTAVVEAVGGFDEGYLAGREHSDLSLRVAATGGTGWVEPAVVVRYPRDRLRHPSDLAFYLPRWSQEWAEASFAHFNEAWELGETSLDDWYLQGTFDRRLRCGPRPADGWRRSVWRQRRRLHRAFDRVATPRLVRRHVRQCGSAAPIRPLHLADWDRSVAPPAADPSSTSA